MLDMRSTAHTVCSERPLIGATRLFMVGGGIHRRVRVLVGRAQQLLGRALVQHVVGAGGRDNSDRVKEEEES